MRQYYILYKRGTGPRYARLHPGRDASIYTRHELAIAVAFLAANPFIEGVAVRIEDEMFNVISFVQEAEAPLSFPMPA